MFNEIKLFVDDIKPALLISEKEYNKNIDILKDYKYKKIQERGYLFYKNENDIKEKSLGEILGYPPICSKVFEERRGENKPEVITNNFLNYGGIYFNCFEYYEEALEWCNQKYKDKMISKYGKIDVVFKEMEFKKNYLQGYTGSVKRIKRFEISR